MSGILPNLIESNIRWDHKAACKEAPLEFFFESYERNAIIAKRQDMVCHNCPVKRQCLEWAINNQATGLHGEIYLSLGKYAKNKNRHKTPEQAAKLIAEVDEIQKMINKRAKHG